MRNIIFIGLLALTFLGCADRWDDHYGEKDGNMEVSDKNVLEFLEGKPEYSAFVKLLKDTRADSVLKTGKRYSVWALSNENMPDLSGMSDSLKRLTMQNHITWGDYYNAGFKDCESLQAYSGKRLRLHLAPEGTEGFVIQDAAIVKTNMACSDGVVHEVGTLLELQPTIYKYFVKEPKYSLLKEIVETYVDSVFNKKASTVIDTNMYGDLVYDSVFTYVYQIYNQAPIHADLNYFTVFLTDNEQLQQVMDNYYDNYRLLNFGAEPDAKDSLKLKNWIAKSFIHLGLVENYGNVKNLYSLQGLLWKTDYEDIVPGSRKEFSNGYVYEMQNLRLPNSLLMQSVSLPIFDIYNAGADNIMVDASCEEELSVTKTTLKADGINYAAISVQLAGGPAEDVPPISFKMSVNTAVVGRKGELVPQYFNPGQYKVSLRVMRTQAANQDFRLLVNDVYVGTVKLSKYTQVNKVISIDNLGVVDIPVTAGVTPLKLTFENLGTGYIRTLAPVSVVLEKTINNY